VLGGAGIQNRKRVSFARAARDAASKSRAATSTSRNMSNCFRSNSARRESSSRCSASAARLLLLFLRRGRQRVRQALRHRGIEVGQITQCAFDAQVRIARTR